jgi:hypothetical protein
MVIRALVVAKEHCGTAFRNMVEDELKDVTAKPILVRPWCTDQQLEANEMCRDSMLARPARIKVARMPIIDKKPNA